MNIKIVTPVSHDGQELSPGSVVTMEEGPAKRLINLGAAEATVERVTTPIITPPADPPKVETPQSPPPPAAEPTEEEIVAASGESAEFIGGVIAAIDLLEKGNAKHWTAKGLPDCFALQNVMEVEEVSAKARDAAWTIYQRRNREA